MKKLLTVLVMFCVIFVVGCGSKNTTSGSSSSPAGTTAASASSEAPKGEVKVMKMATANAKDRSLTRGLVKFGELVEKETNGSIKVEVYPDGQLGGDIQVFEAMKIGSVQGSTMSTGPIASFSKRFNIFDLPFLFKDAETAYKVLDGDIGQELLSELPAAGVVGLGYMENGFRDLTNNKREVKSPDDVKGLKIRTLENELHIELWKTLGATPTPMAITELFTALEQKVVDGQENPSGNIKLNKFYEVQKYVTKTGHVYNASPLIISNKFWEQLSDQEKEAIKKAAAESITWQRAENQKESKEAYDFLAQNGMTVTELTPEEKQKFVDALKPVYDKFKPTIGEDLVNKLLEAVK
ncbi:ABC transporter substrate-binding protein [Cohnella kolymensis]|uniref:ABC transporter substrate-binding protein n=1 Tax=Cohnella kolymensis TaxID=1590652 RepID=A0ABR5A5V1_9BACL|nr:DctP family TRAP transporter solute-binding subunit [Cohnella kolymensis]KIL35817.1 ABC transporter substrate-binding protein [Cohnella kolymensis]